MKQFIDKNRKILFFLILGCTFICAYAFFYLTPYLSDDYAYMAELRDLGTGSIKDVFTLAYAEYFQHGGRLLHYTTFRLFYYLDCKTLYNIVASLMFVILGLLIYANVTKTVKYDLPTIMGSYLMIWLFSIRPGQTIFWICGSVVYLFATVYILASITLYRHLLENMCTVVSKANGKKNALILTILMFIISLLAGNCSENNSGAAVLLLILLTINKYLNLKKLNKYLKLKSFIKPYMITAFLGYFIGFFALILSPGTHSRAGSIGADDYTGIVGLLSHVYKLTLAVDELFRYFIIVIIILFVIITVSGYFNDISVFRNNTAVLFIVMSLAATYALSVISTPELRAFFGVSIFLSIVIIDLINTLRNDKEIYRILRYSAVSILCMLFVFTYLDSLVDLARIHREKAEQVNIIEEAVANGNTAYVEIPMLHDPFDNRFTIAYYPQLGEEPGFWLNVFYEEWFGIEDIVAIPRDVWDENH